jgi:N-acetyl-alpha-D-glucosaminyl L-malate synthase BshA
MKIGVTCYPTYGGSGAVATELGIELSKRGHEIHFICYARPYRLPAFTENVYFHEVEVSKYPLFEYPPYSIALASRMVDVAIHSELDLLHVHYAIPHAASAIMAKQMLNNKLKIVTTLHGTDITIVGQDPTFSNVIRFAMENSDAITTVSHFLKEKTYETFGIAKDIEVIHNFKNPENSESLKSEKSYFGIRDEHSKILVHVSNFRPIKRVEDVIRVAGIVNNEFSLTVLMVGDGPDRQKAERLSRELGIEKNVIFLGKQMEVQKILKHGDVFVFPSESESFGLAALESLILGVPVVAYNVGGLQEVVEHGKNGFLCELGNIEKMAENVKKLLRDEKKYSEFQKNAINSAKENFRGEKIVPKYEELYERLLSE